MQLRSPTIAAPARAPNPVVARRKLVRETAYLLTAIVLAIVGQGFIGDREHGNTSIGLAFYAVAIFLTTRVAASLFSSPDQEAIASPTPVMLDVGWLWPRAIRQPLVTGLCIAAAACLVGALIIFERSNGTARNVAVALYLLGLALGLVVAWRLDPPGRGIGSTWTRRDTLSLVVVLAIAAFFRLWHIDSEPSGLWYDEAAHGLDVLHILADPAFRPVYLSTLVPEPALAWYFDAIFFVLLGPTIFALRISAILAGLVAVAGVYLLARQSFGWRTGVVAGAFLAIASWHVNFSRVMFNMIWSVALDTLGAYFLYQALRTNRFRYYALAGTWVGLGLNNGNDSRLFCVAAAVYVAYRFALEHRTFLKRTLAGLVVFGSFVVLSAGPLLEFAVLHSDQFNARVTQVSIFGEIQRQQNLDPLISSVQRHVEMFNYQGDPNGRHNLSGSPELDQIMGALFVVGLALALRRWRDPRFGLPMIWFPAILAGGILSLSFEAPQSERTLENSVVTIIFAAIPVGALWSRLTWARITSIRLPVRNAGAVAVSAGALVAAVLFGWSAVLNYHKYFVLQAENGRTWAEFSSPQTEIGQEVSHLDLNTTDVYLSSVFLSEPTIHFLAPNFHDEIMFDPAKDLPFSHHRAVMVYLANTDDRTVLEIQRFYPNATVRTFAAPDSSTPGLYAVSISAADVTSLQGLAADYYAGQQVSGKPVRTGRDPALDFDWGRAQTPLPVPFTVNWHGVLAAPQFGSYLLKVQGPPGSELYVDENLVVKGAGQQSVTLAEGLHAFRLVATVTEPAPFHLQWQPPGTPVPIPIPPENLFGPPATARGLLGKYYPSPSWQGQPAKEQIDPTMKYNFHIVPLPRPYSVDWTGKLDIPLAGAYGFGTDSVDTSWIYVDGKLVGTNQGRPDHRGQGTIQLTEGLHDFEVKFQDQTGFSYLTVLWQPPGFQVEPVPGDRLFPPQGAYPDRAGPLKQVKVQATPGAQPVGAPAQAQPPPQANANPSAPAAIGTLPVSTLHQLQAFGEPGEGVGQLKAPRGVAVDAQGNVYIVDSTLARVVKFDPTGKFLLAFGSKGGGPDQFNEPVDAVVDNQGQIDVLDSDSGAVKRFTADGKFVSQFGGAAIGPYHPRAIAIDSAGNFYLADAGTGHIDRLSPSGDLIEKDGEHGAAPGQIGEPVGVAVGADGSIYVADSANSRLSHFDSTFHLIQAWAIPHSTSVQGPKIAIGDDQTIYVSDPDGQRIIHFDVQGQPTEQMGAPGELRRPIGLRNDGHGHFYVADSDAGRVYEYGVQ